MWTPEGVPMLPTPQPSVIIPGVKSWSETLYMNIIDRKKRLEASIGQSPPVRPQQRSQEGKEKSSFSTDLRHPQTHSSVVLSI